MGVFIDLTGKQFGEWHVISFLGGKNCEWLCKCSCGKTQNVRSNALRNNLSKSCSKCYHLNSFEDLVGQKFGKWTALNYDRASSKRPRWQCQCDCGTKGFVTAIALKNGGSKQCDSCFRLNSRLDLNGKIFGKWTVLKWYGKKIKRSANYWLCKCECGEEQTVSSSSLVRGRSRSCKYCARKINPMIKMLNRLKHRVKHNHFTMNLNIKYLTNLLEKQNSKCALTNVNISIDGSKAKNIFPSASLDRIDSSKGYIKGNVQWVHKTVNKMKWDTPQDEFINWCKLIAKKLD